MRNVSHVPLTTRYVEEIAGESGATLFRATLRLYGQELVTSDHATDFEAAFARDLCYRALVSRVCCCCRSLLHHERQARQL